jgi:3-oxoacyl-[acyl-carrier protein] reductase
MKQYSVSVIIHPTDLSIGENVTGLIEACGDVDIVVNNAGSVPGGGVEDVDETRWGAAWDLKVFGYINVTRSIYLRMKVRRRGVILNIIGNAGNPILQRV